MSVMGAASAAGGRGGGDGQQATRYLCAAAHLDEGFARRAVAEFLVDERRALAPALGVDSVTVLRHCLAARSRRLHRDAALCVVLGVALLAAVWATLAWLVWLGGLWVLVWAARGGGRPRAAPVLGAVLWVGVGVVGFALLVGDGDPYGLRGGWTRHAAAQVSVAQWVWVPVAAGFCCWLVVFADRLAVRGMLAGRLRRDRFTPQQWISAEPAWAQRSLAELATRAEADRQVLAEADRPWPGAGVEVSRRRWLLDTGPGEFDVADLLDRVGERLVEPSGGLDAAGRLGAARVDECVSMPGPVLVAGSTGDGSLRLLPGAGGPGRRARRIRVAGDPAELIVTAYLSASAGGGLLQVDVRGLVLAPIDAAYRVVDRMPPLGFGVLLAVARRAAVELPRRVASAPGGALRTAGEPLRRWHRRTILEHAARQGFAVAAGARTSLREMGAGDLAAHAWAADDANLYLAVVERRLRQELGPLLRSGDGVAVR
jgi:hypothetical protein